jgi:glycolate oxidase iron-sulfur subunit
MQTSFASEQLHDHRVKEAEQILRRCVHCGLCTATCPSYLVLGDERDSPRGRIYLIKDMLEQGVAPAPELTRHVDRCLSCLSCMTTCPSGVDYMHLVDIARARIHEHGGRSFKDRLLRGLLAGVLPHPWRFRLAIVAAILGRPLASLFGRIGLKPVQAMLELAPRGLPRIGTHRATGAYPAEGPRRQRVIMLRGCAQRVLRPEINDATIRLLTRIGVEVVVPDGAGCCGALVQHMGREAEARAQARSTIKAWAAAMGEQPLDAVIVNASGCGTTVKDYGHLFARDVDTWRQATHFAGLAKDITEFLARQDLGAPKRWSSLRVAYHSACSMQHGQRIGDEPRQLLRDAGFAVVEFAEGHICCGSAGTYNILQPDLAGELRSRKIANIERVKPDVIATGNIGCITQIAAGTDIPVVHTVELLDWAYGGPAPRELRGLADRVRDVPDTKPRSASRPLTEIVSR